MGGGLSHSFSDISLSYEYLVMNTQIDCWDTLSNGFFLVFIDIYLFHLLQAFILITRISVGEIKTIRKSVPPAQLHITVNILIKTNLPSPFHLFPPKKCWKRLFTTLFIFCVIFSWEMVGGEISINYLTWYFARRNQTLALYLLGNIRKYSFSAAGIKLQSQKLPIGKKYG